MQREEVGVSDLGRGGLSFKNLEEIGGGEDGEKAGEGGAGKNRARGAGIGGKEERREKGWQERRKGFEGSERRVNKGERRRERLKR